MMKTKQEYQEIYNVTCCLLKTFKGKSGKAIVTEVNELMNRVNQTIMTQITGEEPSGCTHNCSTCGADNDNDDSH